MRHCTLAFFVLRSIWLHRCSIYQSAETGKKLNDMLSMGLSWPRPEALEKIAGTKQMDATAILDYFNG